MQNGLDSADANRHGHGLAGTHLVFRFALQFQQLLRINQKVRAGRRQLELLSRAVEQQHAHFLFQRGDAAGHGRLREKSFSAAREMLLSEATP